MRTAILHYIELAAGDPGYLIGRAALVDLLDDPGLTEEQLEAVPTYPPAQEIPTTVKTYRQLKLLRSPVVPDVAI